MIVEIHWIDSMSYDTWVSIDTLSDKSGNIKTVGYRIRETDDGVIVAGSLDEDNSNVSGTMMIPWECIKEYYEYS